MKKITFLFVYGIMALIISSTLVFSPFAVQVEKAEATGLFTGATEFTQLANKAELSISAIANTSTAASTGLTAVATTQNFIKENLLDGIGWAIAKQMVSSMTRSLINWINSGFQGSPAFIFDLKAHLLNALDTVAGEYIRGLGGIGEFICSPFRLDVQAALSISYAQTRSGMPSGPTACTLSGIGDNIENFLQGTMGSWDQWFKVTANPQNTPYGAYLEAEAKLNARLINEAGQEIEIANWGDGFLSKKICESIEGRSGPGPCKIVTPGKQISEALTFQLSTGPRTLIEADEINEIIGALINQLVLKAVQGINGILGLGGNSRYTEYDADGFGTGSSTLSYLDALDREGVPINTSTIKARLDDQRAREVSYLRLINATIAATAGGPSGSPATTTASTSITGTIGTSTLVIDLDDVILEGVEQQVSSSTVRAVYNDALALRPIVEDKIALLDAMITSYDNASDDATPERSVNDIQKEVVLEYLELDQAGIFTSESELETKRVEWSRVVREI